VPKVSAEHKAGVRRRLVEAAGRVVMRVGADGVTTDGMNRRAASDTFATSFERVGNAARTLVAAGVLEPAR